MNAIARTVRAVLALFFDDGKLALEMLVLLALSALVANAEAPESWYAIAALVSGTVILLFANVMRDARSAELARRSSLPPQSLKP